MTKYSPPAPIRSRRPRCSPLALARSPRRTTTALAWFRPFAPLLLILFLARCFEYGEMPRDRLSAGRDVRVTITAAGRALLASKIGTQVRSLTGRVQTADSSGVTVAMARTTLMDGSDASWNNELVQIPAADIASVEQRKMSGGKTIALVAIIAGVTAAVALSVGLSAANSGSSGPSGTAK